MAMIRQPENSPETVKEVRWQLALSQEELTGTASWQYDGLSWDGVHPLLAPTTT